MNAPERTERIARIDTVERRRPERSLSARLGLAGLTPRRELLATFAVLGLAAAAMLLALVLPGRTFLTSYGHDMMVFLDGADRVLDGQVPNRDFHSPLGPLAFWLPAFGLWAGGSLGAMFPWATALFAMFAVPLVAYVAGTRLPLIYALGFGLFAAVLLIAPLNPGEFADASSYAMFYNRWGWVLLSTLCLLVLPRKLSVGSSVLDGLTAGLFLFALFYLKISYAGFALLLLAGLILFPRSRRAGLIGLGTAAAGAIAVELFWSGTAGYLRDIGVAAAASGAVRGTIFGVGRTIVENLTECLLLAGLLLIGWMRGVHLAYLAAAALMAGAGLLLINQNSQLAGIITLVPAGLVALLAPRADRRINVWPELAGGLILLALVAELTLTSAVALGYQALKSLRGPSGEPTEAQVDGMFASEGADVALEPGLPAVAEAYRAGGADLETLNLLRHARFRQRLPQPEYLRSIDEGARLLRSDPRLAGSVFVLDFANPMNALTGRSAPRGVDAWNHAGRTMSLDVHRPAAAMFADVPVLMVPKAPVELHTHQLLRKLYWPYLTAHYRPVAETTYWRAYRRIES